MKTNSSTQSSQNAFSSSRSRLRQVALFATVTALGFVVAPMGVERADAGKPDKGDGGGGNGGGKGGGGKGDDGGKVTTYYSVLITDNGGAPSLLFNVTGGDRIGRNAESDGRIIVNHISEESCALNSSVDTALLETLADPDQIDGDWSGCFPGGDLLNPNSASPITTVTQEEGGTMLITPAPTSESPGNVEVKLNFQAKNKSGKQQGYCLVIQAETHDGSLYDPRDPNFCDAHIVLGSWELFGNSGRTNRSCSGNGDFAGSQVITVKRDRNQDAPCLLDGSCGF